MSYEKRHIVLVEDEVALGEICQELLTANGFKTTLYTSAAAALQGTADCEMDLLVTDVGLADKSGWELASEINTHLRQANKPEVPVLFVSGGFLPLNGSAEPNCYYLEKPFSIFALLKQVTAIFDAQVPNKRAG